MCQAATLKYISVCCCPGLWLFIFILVIEGPSSCEDALHLLCQTKVDWFIQIRSVYLSILKGHPHGKALCTRTFWIVLANRLNGSCKYSAYKRTFLKPGVRMAKFENAALAFSFGQRIRILCISMMPSPHPSTSSLPPLNPAMSHNNNNNNNNNNKNSGLHACVHADEDIEPYSPCSRVWVTAAVQPHYRSAQTILVSLH